MDDSEKSRPDVVIYRLTETHCIYRLTETHCTICKLFLVATRGTADKQDNCRASALNGVLMKRTRNGWVAVPVEVISSFWRDHWRPCSRFS